MQQWAKCILVLAWKMTMVGVQAPSTSMVEENCPGFKCSGTPECYLIYYNTDGWKYNAPNGTTHEVDAEVHYTLQQKCYTLIRVNEGMKSCNDAQLECERVGGNITVINNESERKQMRTNVLQIQDNLNESDIEFTFHVKNVKRNRLPLCIAKGCNKITIEDNDYSTTPSTTHMSMVNTIFCESTVKDVNMEICSVPTTDAMETPPPLTTTSSTTAASPPVHQALTTDETTAEQTSMRPIFTENQSEMEAGQSEMEAGGNLWMVAVVASVVVIAIIIILLSFLFIRRRRTKAGYSSGPNQHLPSIGQPIEDGNQDRATVSYSGGGDGVVINEYSTIEDHNQDLDAAVYHILEATDSPAPTSVTNDAYAVPYGDAATKDGVQDQEYDTLNAADMHSRSPQQNGLDGHGYAVPNKNSKGRKKQDVGEADDALNAADIHSRSPQQNGLGGHGYAVPNKNSKGRKANELDVNDAYDTLNATDMQPASKQRRGKPDDAFDDAYNMLNTAEVHSKSGKHNVGSGNEYGKLQNAADVPPKDGMYSYVTTEVGSGIVTMTHAEDQTYDKLQRNTELGGALTADHHYGSLQ